MIFPDTESSKRTLCVYNLSRFVQPVTLRLDSWRGGAPVEGIGGQRFPAVGDAPYFLSLGPHSFFWFRKRP